MYLAHHELECVFIIIGISAILSTLVCHITCLQIWSGGKNRTKHKLTMPSGHLRCIMHASYQQIFYLPTTPAELQSFDTHHVLSHTFLTLYF